MNKVLRASKIGFPCTRNLFYAVNDYEGITSPQSQRIFDVGTYLEPMVVDWLRADGWEVEYNPGSQEAQLEVSLLVEDGLIAGHPDCFISKGDLVNVLVDIKTMNDRAYTQWKREGTLASKPQYVDQLHAYAMGCIHAGISINTHTLGVVAVNKNNSDWHIDFFDLDFGRIADLQDRASAIFSMSEPPTEDSPREAWCCNYCEYSHMCERKGTKPKQEIPPITEIGNLGDLNISSAMHDLIMARDLAKQAKIMEAEAKQTLLAEAKAKGNNTIQAGGFTCRITEKKAARFDTASFKQAHPDLAEQYTTTSTTTYFDIKEAI